VALYHLNAKTGTRANGQSACKKAHYLARLGQYARARVGSDRDKVLHVESGHMPLWACEAEGTYSELRSATCERYWRAADDPLKGERINGRLFKEIEVALPRELNLEQRISLTRAFAKRICTLRDGALLAFTFALHAGKGTNPHAHLLVSERVNDGIERSADRWFKRAAAKGRPAEDGGAKKTDELKPADWLVATRELWAEMANNALEEAGSDARIDHRSHAARGLSDLPTEHVGWAAGRPRQEALARNDQRRDLNHELRDLMAQRVALDQPQELDAASALEGTHDHSQQRNIDRGTGRPGHVDVGLSGIAIVADRDVKQPAAGVARPGARGQAEPYAGETPRGATPAREPRVRDLPGRPVDGHGSERPASVLHGHANDVVDPGRADIDRNVRRAGTSLEGEPHRVTAPLLQGARAPSLAEVFAAASGNELLTAQFAWMRMGQDFAERMQRIIARVEVAKAAKAAAASSPEGALHLSAVQRLASLIRRPTQPVAAAVSHHQPAPVPEMGREIEDMLPRDLREQLQITKAALREAARVMATGAGGPASVDAAAGRFGTLNARAKALQAAVSALDTPALDEQAKLEDAWRKAHDVTTKAAQHRNLRQAVANAWAAVDQAKALQAAAAKPGAWWWPGAQKRADAARQQARAARLAADASLRAAIAAAKRGGAGVKDRLSNSAALSNAIAYAKRCKSESDRLAGLVAPLRAKAIAAARDAEAADLKAGVEALQMATEVARSQAKAQAKQVRQLEASPAQRKTNSSTEHYPVPGSRRRKT